MWKNAELEYKEEVKYRSPRNKFTHATISHLSPSVTNVKWSINLWQPHVLVMTKGFCFLVFFAPPCNLDTYWQSSFQHETTAKLLNGDKEAYTSLLWN